MTLTNRKQHCGTIENGRAHNMNDVKVIRRWTFHLAKSRFHLGPIYMVAQK